MNRHERRAAAARGDDSYGRYVRHLPRVPVDAPYERGRVYHTCFHHDDWCRFFVTGRPADCDCDPRIERYVEPVRS